MQITRNPSLTEQQFLGCVSAFVDVLNGELNSGAMYLRKLQGQPKGAAFAFEMSLDRHRYGALTVLDRWLTLVSTFGPHQKLSRYADIIAQGRRKVRDAEELLQRANQLIDAAEGWPAETVEACLVAFQSVAGIFQEERECAGQSASLGPMLTEEFREARGVFVRDLSAR
ncbi:MAG: hypothetical protein U0Q18_22930 [Bryobacteraceae bacterium]